MLKTETDEASIGQSLLFKFSCENTNLYYY